jgi:hypothetical protein
MTAWSELHAATLELTKGTSLKQRLTSAYSKHLQHIDAGTLPSDLRQEFTELIGGLESVRPLPGESAVQATVRKMSGDEADLYAARIVELFGNLARRLAVADDSAYSPLAAVNGSVVVELAHSRYAGREDLDGDIPPLYAAEA